MTIRLLATTLAAIAVSTAAQALEFKPYSASGFKAAQAAGQPILVDVHATWCPTCKAQNAVLQKIKDKPEYKDVTVFRVDFDDQKSAVRGFGASQQSTLIAFKGDKETGRSVGATKAAAIESLIASATK